MTMYTEPRAFYMREAALGGFKLTAAVLFLPTVFLFWFFISLLLGPLPEFPGRGLLALGLAVAATILLVRWRVGALRAHMRKAPMTLSAFGIEARDVQGGLRKVAWSDLVAVTQVRPVAAAKPSKMLFILDNPLMEGLANIGVRDELGLIGRGTLDTTGCNLLIKETYRQNRTTNGKDPLTGEPYIALYPLQYEDDWTNNEIGAWVRHYRPDLLAPPSAGRTAGTA